MRPRQGAHPVVSVILCTFNRRALLARAVDSVRRQELENWELLVIDDGSTDGTVRDLRRMAASDPRIRYRRQSNRGLARARNAGLRLARGKYAAFLDSDDEYMPRHLFLRVGFLRRNPRLHGVYGGLRAVGPRGLQYVPDVERPGRKIHASRCHAAGTLVARVSTLRRAGGFRLIPFAEDYDLILRLMVRVPLGMMTERTYLYHVAPEDRLCRRYGRTGKADMGGLRRGELARRQIG
ncbi:MAG: glycosyltransferase family A protein [Bacteroidota bacterium]